MAREAEQVSVHEDDSSERLDVLGGAEEIEGLLSGPADSGQAEDAGAREEDDLPPESDGDEPAEVEGQQDDLDAEAGEEPGGDDLGEPEPDEDADEPDGDSELDLSQTVTVQVDGEEQEVTLDELRGGYMRDAAFTKKTQELAEQRREVQQEAERLQQGQKEYAQRLDVVEQVMEAIQPEKPNPELRRSNPEMYAEQMEAYEERQEQIEAVQAERQEALKQLQEQQAQVQQAKLEQEQEMLEAHIPELVDPSQRDELMGRMVETAQETYGFSPEELSNVVDHRAIRLLHDAMKYHDLEEQGKQITQSKQEKPAKKMKPGSSTKSKETEADNSDALKRLARSGRVKDAAKVLEGMI